MSLSIGERLKSARSAKGVSLEMVARTTKIQRRILQALEEDRVEEVLDSSYSKIFMKKYAAYLGLDGAVLVEEYQASHSPPALEQPVAPAPLAGQTKSGDSSRFSQILIPAGLGLLALIGLSFFGYLAMDLFHTVQETRKAVPGTKGTGYSAVRVPLVPGTKVMTVERVPAAPKLLVPRAVPLKLTVQTKADVWMQVKSDGAVIFQNVLTKGSRESWTAKQELELWTGNAGAMELTLNGQSLGSPGSGVKKGIKITHEGLREPG